MSDAVASPLLRWTRCRRMLSTVPTPAIDGTIISRAKQCTLFMNIRCVVEYYLVDYNSRSIFWVENIDILTNLGGIGSSVEPFESTRHLRSALQPEFWVHMEYYPCHQPTYHHEAEKKLTVVL
ncbi:hypothetical protein M407DRAFT_26802 [Tulasnella calospora MUT 4182]|uniref:Uncharacterized protein n=1 Tax=Tulasnella calospora MUT 4182 TaxID=1051891 RepID=A0A0C3QF08_9AGAM|nr:hypothetical protein M407DRAFT_26802 [Tulasnella calospora MUT 4182]